MGRTPEIPLIIEYLYPESDFAYQLYAIYKKCGTASGAAYIINDKLKKAGSTQSVSTSGIWRQIEKITYEIEREMTNGLNGGR